MDHDHSEGQSGKPEQESSVAGSQGATAPVRSRPGQRKRYRNKIDIYDTGMLRIQMAAATPLSQPSEAASGMAPSAPRAEPAWGGTTAGGGMVPPASWRGMRSDRKRAAREKAAWAAWPISPLMAATSCRAGRRHRAQCGNAQSLGHWSGDAEGLRHSSQTDAAAQK